MSDPKPNKLIYLFYLFCSDAEKLKHMLMNHSILQSTLMKDYLS